MLIYGDASRQIEPEHALTRLTDGWGALAAAPAGIERHAALTGLFIDAAELAQGIADAAFERRGADAPSAVEAALFGLLLDMAEALRRSSENGHSLPLPDLHAHAEQLRVLGLPRSAACRRQEGFAFYSLYPETYLAAARELAVPLKAVVGIRSIGLGLAAIVARVTQSPVLVSVRPTGQPSRRILALTPEMKAVLATHREGHAAIVDEGPGLSGSSFAAAAEALESVGFARKRVHFFPSHAGLPGPEATEAIRARWQAAPRHVVGFEEVAHRLPAWCADLTGPAVAPLEDIGAGEWRRHRAGAANIPYQPMWERRKYLLRTGAGTFLLRFAGLGRYGQKALRRAQALSDAGFTPPVRGLRYGFLVQDWMGDAEFLDPSGPERARLLARLADYLSFRARRLPARPETGAPLEALAAMLECNAREGLDIALPEARLRAQARALEGRVRRVETDNRLHAWEWLRTRDGRILKTDAFDHCAAHDLVGCQDIAWDLAGAIFEFSLSPKETDALIRAMDVTVDRDLLAFLRTCYLAAQLAGFNFTAISEILNPNDKVIAKLTNDKYRISFETELLNFI